MKLAVDLDQLKQELPDVIVEDPLERYHLNWPGKREALSDLAVGAGETE